MRSAHDAGDWRDVTDEIEIELFVERGVDGIRCTNHQERITVSRGTNDSLGAQIGACTRSILDD
jgi:hypothetical protein